MSTGEPFTCEYITLLQSLQMITNDSQRSYSFGKTQNVGVPELSQEKKISVSLQKDFIFCFHTHTHTHTRIHTHTHTERDRHTHTHTDTHTHTHTHTTFLVLQKIFHGGDRRVQNVRSNILRSHSTSPTH